MAKMYIKLWLFCLPLMVESEILTGDSFTCTSNSEFSSIQLDCDDGVDCIVNCGSYTSCCEGATINGPATSGNLTIIGSAHNALRSSKIYCPSYPNQCSITVSGDYFNLLSNTEIYSENGLSDISLICNYPKNIAINCYGDSYEPVLYCGDFSASCNIHLLSGYDEWDCDEAISCVPIDASTSSPGADDIDLILNMFNDPILLVMLFVFVIICCCCGVVFCFCYTKYKQQEDLINLRAATLTKLSSMSSLKSLSSGDDEPPRDVTPNAPRTKTTPLKAAAVKQSVLNKNEKKQAAVNKVVIQQNQKKQMKQAAVHKVVIHPPKAANNIRMVVPKAAVIKKPLMIPMSNLFVNKSSDHSKKDTMQIFDELQDLPNEEEEQTDGNRGKEDVVLDIGDINNVESEDENDKQQSEQKENAIYDDDSDDVNNNEDEKEEMTESPLVNYAQMMGQVTIGGFGAFPPMGDDKTLTNKKAGPGF